MDRKKVILIITILIFSFVGIVAANSNYYKIKFHNQSKETVIYYLYQIDHKIEHVSKPIAFVIGTLNPGEYWQVSREAGGYYYLEWRSETDDLLIKLDPFYLNKDAKYLYTLK